MGFTFVFVYPSWVDDGDAGVCLYIANSGNREAINGW